MAEKMDALRDGDEGFRRCYTPKECHEHPMRKSFLQDVGAFGPLS
ncbi:hypothetical protein PC129_g5079 [Phytophthora cactorum]|uniref:Uncharacterized protein n=1 Tax=Phytophthora cactorum TaxID=29920 RepID=A0A329S735_9STRA|nr:hypothetical protein Pcac1_g4283 [Phytophthora cactorum]KAG2806013.1 hypothetical protein PC112_g18023 [Phytophthora cactorum]KAG2807260.1 hypothetical protein PC111_g17000 [Phytophthora cactorum]KAG2846079.1 hypothetical protein PC113_g18049 [Phytophthora cactorum]KAG2896599.1 hypothetical protein PC115_g17469 [Phytophthora cactorum]